MISESAFRVKVRGWGRSFERMLAKYVSRLLKRSKRGRRCSERITYASTKAISEWHGRVVVI